MPRTARIKDNNGIYHIMIRSISEIKLFRDDLDRNEYLKLISKYQKIYYFKIYAFCLLSTHSHFIIDSYGADISSIMKSINQSYAIYYNKKYNRHGHLFQDRFKSKLIPSYSYLLTLSAYIHNNVKDIKKYHTKIDKYTYSSLKTYIDKNNNPYNLIDTSYILSIYDQNLAKAKLKYIEFINYYLINKESSLSETLEFSNEHSKYLSGKVFLFRDSSPNDIIAFIKNYTGGFNIHIKYLHSNSDLKAISILALKSLCNLSNIQIAEYIGNITASQISKLTNKGLALLMNNTKYSSIIDDLINFSLNKNL